MPDIGNYTTDIRLLLGEAGKYFVLLLFCVLAIRLWRRWATVAAAKNAGGLFWAVTAAILAAAIGYVSMCQSLSSLYSYYGMRAFRDGRLPQALSLFDTAEQDCRSADTLGQCGVCRLLLGDAYNGLTLIAQARTLRQGKGTPFEDFYEGLYYFTKGDVSAAVPLLQAAGADDLYRWSVIKIFAVMELDENRVADAVGQMKPFMQADVTEFDQAYIMAAVKLADGKKAEAQALLEKFPATGLSPMWQARYEKLRSRLQD
jgi:tetratricopeptide (TPR) repeat protein